MRQIFPKDENVNMNLEVPTFVNTRKNDYILSKKYTNEEEGLTMKRLNKKIETINNIILAVAMAGILFWLLGDGLFGHLGGLVVTIIVTVIPPRRPKRPSPINQHKIPIKNTPRIILLIVTIFLLSFFITKTSSLVLYFLDNIQSSFLVFTNVGTSKFICTSSSLGNICFI